MDLNFSLKTFYEKEEIFCEKKYVLNEVAETGNVLSSIFILISSFYMIIAINYVYKHKKWKKINITYHQIHLLNRNTIDYNDQINEINNEIFNCRISNCSINKIINTIYKSIHFYHDKISIFIIEKNIELYVISFLMFIAFCGSVFYHTSLYRLGNEICNISMLYITCFIWFYLSNFYYQYKLIYKIIVFCIYFIVSVISIPYKIDFILYLFNYISQIINISFTYLTVKNVCGFYNSHKPELLIPEKYPSNLTKLQNNLNSNNSFYKSKQDAQSEIHINVNQFYYLIAYFFFAFLFYTIDIFYCQDIFMYINLHVLWHLYISIGYYKWIQLLRNLKYINDTNNSLLNSFMLPIIPF